MSPTGPEGRDIPETKPIPLRPSYIHEHPIHYVPLPRKSPRKLDREKCQHCREAKKKCEKESVQQGPSCRRCVQKGLQCPGPTKTKGKESIQQNANLAMNMQLNINVGLSLELKQLEAKPCLVCSALGLSCTSRGCGKMLCQNCLHAYSSNILQYRLCMRDVPFQDLSIFLRWVPKAEIPRFDIDLGGISVDFDVNWTLPSIMKEVAEFLRTAPTKPTSKVGLLCSPDFVKLIQNHIPHEVALLFQSMLYGMSSTYSNLKRVMRVDVMLHILGAQAGHQILRYLDNELNQQKPSVASIEKRQVLFLLVFGTILAIRYGSGVGQELPSTDPGDEKLKQMMQEHLCEMLAHHLVLLGTFIGVLFCKDEEERVLRLPAVTWNREGTHVWEVQACKPHRPPSEAIPTFYENPNDGLTSRWDERPYSWDHRYHIVWKRRVVDERSFRDVCLYFKSPSSRASTKKSGVEGSNADSLGRPGWWFSPTLH